MMKKLRAFPVRLETNKNAHPHCFYLTQHQKPQKRQADQKKKKRRVRERERKGIQTGSEEGKLSLFADNMILYTENPKGYQKIIRTNEFSKVARCFMNYHKEKSINASRRVKHLGINLTQEVKNLYPENYKTLRKETDNDTSK